MIDEKRLVEQLNELKDKCWDRAKKENNINFARKQLDISQVIGIINIQPKIGGWIPCSERLPEEPFGCLVTVIDTNPMTMEDFENILPYHVGYDGNQWNNSDGEQIPFDVIAWQPLPEAYHE